MPGSKSDVLENALLNHVLGGPDYVRPATVYLGLFSVAPTDAAGGTELTGGAWARKPVTNNATNFPGASGGSKSLAAGPHQFDPAPSDAADANAWGIFDAASGGNLMYWGWLGSDAGKVFTATVADVLTSPGHGFINDDKVRVVAIPGATLPTGLAAGTTYFVISVSGDTFSLSATQGGAAVNITASGAGLIAKITPKPVTSGDTPQFSGGALVISED
jgi:hypothetical protein